MSMMMKLARRLRGFLNGPVLGQRMRAPEYLDAVAQLQLMFTYRAIVDSGGRCPSIDDVGFKVFSQTNEDGILLYIFSIIGTTNKRAVEICAGSGIQCNTSNLIINHGWVGLLVDGDEKSVQKGRAFYREHDHTSVYPPTFVHSWVTRANVNDLLRANDFVGEVDLLSIDVDGVDYWVWDAIDAIEPRVVVIEYADIVGPERSLTVPYDDNFESRRYPMTRGMPNFCGASLPALVKLGRKRGYRLVGCNKYGFNAFFVRNPLGLDHIPEVEARACFRHPFTAWGMKERFPTVKDLPWVEV